MASERSPLLLSHTHQNDSGNTTSAVPSLVHAQLVLPSAQDLNLAEITRFLSNNSSQRRVDYYLETSFCLVFLLWTKNNLIRALAKAEQGTALEVCRSRVLRKVGLENVNELIDSCWKQFINELLDEEHDDAFDPVGSVLWRGILVGDDSSDVIRAVDLLAKDAPGDDLIAAYVYNTWVNAEMTGQDAQLRSKRFVNAIGSPRTIHAIDLFLHTCYLVLFAQYVIFPFGNRTGQDPNPSIDWREVVLLFYSLCSIGRPNSSLWRITFYILPSLTFAQMIANRFKLPDKPYPEPSREFFFWLYLVDISFLFQILILHSGVPSPIYLFLSRAFSLHHPLQLSCKIGQLSKKSILPSILFTFPFTFVTTTIWIISVNGDPIGHPSFFLSAVTQARPWTAISTQILFFMISFASISFFFPIAFISTLFSRESDDDNPAQAETNRAILQALLIYKRPMAILSIPPFNILQLPWVVYRHVRGFLVRLGWTRYGG
ncbi:hypothetical protein FRC03_010252 [Tulasnella sp. 419]|nr:hypothetical protein FRC03_010252 [Tulasnella sp. 419]